MSGRHKFSELTKNFTAKDRRKIEATKSEMRLEINGTNSAASCGESEKSEIPIGDLAKAD